jgi:hypothetical protein
MELIQLLARHFADHTAPVPQRWAPTPGPEQASGSGPSQRAQAALDSSVVPQPPPSSSTSSSPALLGLSFREPDRKGKNRAVEDLDQEPEEMMDDQDYPPLPRRREEDDDDDFQDAWGGVST